MLHRILHESLQRERRHVLIEQKRRNLAADSEPIAKANLLDGEVPRHEPPLIIERHLIALFSDGCAEQPGHHLGSLRSLGRFRRNELYHRVQRVEEKVWME